jgi:hypothetical protein
LIVLKAKDLHSESISPKIYRLLLYHSSPIPILSINR